MAGLQIINSASVTEGSLRTLFRPLYRTLARSTVDRGRAPIFRPIFVAGALVDDGVDVEQIAFTPHMVVY